jgi:hypothetical protein
MIPKSSCYYYYNNQNAHFETLKKPTGLIDDIIAKLNLYKRENLI